MRRTESCSLYIFNDTATTEIYTLSLHDALPICLRRVLVAGFAGNVVSMTLLAASALLLGASDIAFGILLLATARSWKRDRKSTRLNSSHTVISDAVFCLAKETLWYS